MPARTAMIRTLAPLAALVAACSTAPSAISTAPSASPISPPPPTLVVTSAAFADGAPIPARYTCSGAGVSPPIDVAGVPAGTTSLALVVDDPDAPGGDYAHWIVFNIPPTATHIAEGALPAGSKTGVSSGGRTSYEPPCPPGGTHNYRFTVYALNSVFALPSGTDAHTVGSAIAQSATADGTLTGTVTAQPNADPSANANASASS